MLALGAAFGMLKILLLYFFFLILHEGVHAFFAAKRGYALGRINLTMGGALIDSEADEFSPSDEIAIAISAPLFNLFVALVFIAFWWIHPESFNYTQDIVVINLAIFGFNILPLFPLDGGRVLLGLLSQKCDRKTATRTLKIITLIAAGLLFVLFIISLFFVPFLAAVVASVNLTLAALSEGKGSSYKRTYFMMRKLSRTKKKGVEMREIVVHKSLPLTSLFRLVDSRHYTTFLIVDDQFKVCRKLTESEIEKILIEQS